MFTIQARGTNAAEIRIFDPIGDNFLGSGLTAKALDDQLQALGEVQEISIRINSPGGSVDDGITIFNALKAHPANKTVTVEGLAASIASVVAMVGDKIRMAEGAMLMIHNPWTLAAGDAEDLHKAAAVLEKYADRLVDIYSRRTGQKAARIRELMDEETWLSGAEAIALGFADESLAAAAEPLSPATAAFLPRFAKTPAKVYAMSTSNSTAPAAASAEAILAAETQRRTSIRSMFDLETYKGQFPDLLNACLDDTRCTIDVARARFLEAIAGTQVGPLGGFGGVVPGAPRGGDFMAAATDALCMRSGIRIEKPHAAAADVSRMSLVEIARTCLNTSGRRAGLQFGNEPSRVIKAALTTSDFPLLLENVLGKSLRAGFEQEASSHTLWTKSSTVPDFRTQSRPILGSAPDLAPVVERGEYTYGSLAEDKAAFTVEKYGRLISVSFEMLVNDDLSSFTVIPQAMAMAARRKEADVVYGLLLANAGAGQTMQDSVALFHVDHGNLIGTGTAISVASLGVAKTLMRRQTPVGGKGYLNLTPRFLIVPPEKETLAESVLASLTRHSVSGSNVVEHATPEWVNRLVLVVEPRLTGNAWYMAADNAQIDTCELARLAGENGPVIEEDSSLGFLTDSRDYKVRHVFGARFLDYRGIVKNNGAA